MENKKKYLLIILGIVLISILGTFAWLTWKSKDTSLVLTIGDIGGTTVTLKPYMIEQSLIPTLTYEGNEVINVTAKNNGTTENDIVLYYKINNIDEELITDSFKYTILKSIDNGETYEDYKNGNFANSSVNEEFAIFGETIPANTTYKYQVYTWLDGENETSSNIQGKSFKAELRASIFNGSVVTVDVPDGLIPVTIANDGVVTTISKEDSTWYNYNQKKWANGVLVTKSSRSTYLNSTGVTIPESDILAYYVYVPRYKYKIWTTGTSAKEQEQEIEILFENKNVPKSMGTQVGEYRTHPGFTFGETELNGIWIGKFETSTNMSSTCYTCSGDDDCETKCNNVSQEPRIKPNVSSLRYQNVSNQFQTSLKFVGGVLSGGITSFAGSDVYGLDNSANSHMAKNTEWSAVAYLSHSKYGINSEIRINNYSSFTTGCGASSPVADIGSTCEIAYGDATSYPQSTTGNITGVFDMSGGEYEHVMGVFANSEGTLWSGYSTTYNSGFNGLLGTDGTSKTDGIAFPESKYYEVYKASSGTTISALTACNGGYCYGHGLSEVNNWYGDYANFVSSEYPWFSRGGYSRNDGFAGAFNSDRDYGSSNSYNGFRSIITVDQQSADYGVITNGLQLYYDGNNNTGEGHSKNSTTWKDLSGNSNDGTLKGAIWGSNYLSFDGLDDWVAINKMNYNNYTIEIITMPTIIKSGETLLIDNWESGGYGLAIKDGNFKNAAYISGGYKIANSSDKAIAGQKYHCVGTYDGSNLKLYINGVLNKTTTASGTIGTPGSNTIMVLGANPGGSSASGDFYSGKMYMVRIYNRALSEDEIKYNYEMDKEKYPDTLSNDEYVIANLQLQYDGINNAGSTHNSSSTTWQDLSGNGKNGTVNGAIWGNDHLSFDGTDDWVAIGQMNYSNYTLEVVTETPEIKSTEQSIISNYESGGYGLSITNGAVFTQAYIGGYKKATSDTTAVTNQKYHYVGTYDGSNLKLYINGVLNKTTAISGSIGSSGSTIMSVGSNPSGSKGGSSFYQGKIYSVRIYNRALTDSEILHNYNIDKNRFNLN